VVADHLGQKIVQSGASIRPSADFDGNESLRACFTESLEVERTGRMRLLAEKRAVVFLAGIEAQRTYRPSSVRNYHASHDYKHAVEVIEYFSESPEELDAYLRLLHIRAKNLIQVPAIWESIERVAAALLERKQLSRTALHSLIRGTR
jgi:hypothetical protein